MHNHLRTRANFEKVTKPDDYSFQCYRRIEPSYPFEWHYHPEMELTLIEEDYGQRVVGDHQEEYGPGDLVLLGPNLPHTWASGTTSTSGDGVARMARAVVVQFDAAFAGPNLLQAPEMRSAREMFSASARGLRFEADKNRQAVKRLSELPDAQGPNRLLGLLEILAMLAGTWHEAELLAGPAFTANRNLAAQQRVDRICQFIQEHLSDSISQAELARQLGMNTSAFSRFFKHATGRTVVEYINEVRISQACRLLLETDDSVLEVCLRSGFGNLSNFNRRFRRLKGLTPSGFRNQFRVQGEAS